jgi:hypothetical protein
VLPKFNTSPEIRRAEGPTTRIRLIMVTVQCLGECGAILRGEYWGAPRSLRQKPPGARLSGFTRTGLTRNRAPWVLPSMPIASLSPCRPMGAARGFCFFSSTFRP